jgi:hypothetical protein
MQAGKIGHAEFALSEAKRAANRLRDQWKKDPWLHGRTIDLGEHEMAFQGELYHWSGSRLLAPAIMDWLRWKFRRLQIDRLQNEAWALLLRDELPRRIRLAGDEPPAGWTEQRPVEPAAWEASGVPVASKRIRRDIARVRREPQPQALPTLSPLAEIDADVIAKIVSDCREVLAPLLARCVTDDERSGLVAALVQYVQEPHSASRRADWVMLQRAFR